MIVAGFGFRSAATVESLSDALDRAKAASDVNAVAVVATASDKSDSPSFTALAGILDAGIIGIEPSVLSAQKTLTQSDASQSARGTGSVAEASALAGVGPGARLLGPRTVSGDGMATCALAKGAAK